MQLRRVIHKQWCGADDVALAIDRHHDVSIRHEVIPKVMPNVAGGRALAALENGIDVAEHAETAYELGDSGAGGAFAGVGQAARAREVE